MLEKELVFLGYSRDPDEAFAVRLADWLRRCSVDVWLDLERIPKGHKPQPLIEQALGNCRRALFLISDQWLDRDWTQFELSRFVHLDAQRVRVAVVRSAQSRLQLPPELSLSRPIIWTDDDPAPEARFWEVFCALGGTAPGPPGSWTRRGQELLARNPRVTGGRDQAPVPGVVRETPRRSDRGRKRMAAIFAGCAVLALAGFSARALLGTDAPPAPVIVKPVPAPPAVVDSSHEKPPEVQPEPELRAPPEVRKRTPSAGARVRKPAVTGIREWD